MVRLLRLLESARASDVRDIASALPEAELAAAIEAVGGRISLALREYILSEGSSALLTALARQAVLATNPPAKTAKAGHRLRGARGAVSRVLWRFDPEADAAFFEVEVSGVMHKLARLAILRGRKGPDGHAVIAPRVKQLLLDAVAEGVGRDDAGERLLTELATADDPDLVRAVLPYAGRLSAGEAARAIMTLDEYGLRAEALQHRGLWAGRGRSFTFLGRRRFDMLPSVSRETVSYPVPGSFSEPYSLKHYRNDIEQREIPRKGLEYVRDAVWCALVAGTVSAAEILERTRPAALTVSLAFCEKPESLRPDERRAMEDMRILVSRYANEGLGDDPQRWVRAVRWIQNYDGTFPALLAATESDEEQPGDRNFNDSLRTKVDTRSVLISVAPRETADRFLVKECVNEVIMHPASAVPLPPALVDYIISEGTETERRRLASNHATPDSVLTRLIEESAGTDVMFDIMDRQEVGQDVFARACAAAPHDDRYKAWVTSRADYAMATVLNALRCNAYDPGWILSVLRATVKDFDEPERIAAYVLLADVVGVEAVWALELDRAGSLDAMASYVRASMATGDAAPLIEAAQAAPIEESRDAPRQRFRRQEESPESPESPDHGSSPLGELIRTRLDGHTERWLKLLELFQSRPDASDEELIAEFPGPPHSPAR